jgi:excisionase family DNA binding protein
MSAEKTLLRVQEFAEILNVTTAAVRRWVLERKVCSTRLGRSVRIPRTEVTRLVEAGFRPAKATRV